MKTLHYIDRLEPQRLFSATAAVERAATDKAFADVVVAYGQGDPSTLPEGVEARQVQNRRQWLTLLYEQMPDIVHVHCQWSKQSKMAIKTAKSRGFRVVASINHEPHPIQRFFSLRRCDRIITGSDKEKNNLLLKIANNRLSVVPHPLLNSGADNTETTRALWQKTIDRHLKTNMTVSTWQGLFTLLRTAVCKDATALRPNSGVPTATEVNNLTLLDSNDWRNLKMYCDKHSLTGIVAEAIWILNQNTKGVVFNRDEPSSPDPKNIADFCEMVKNFKRNFKSVEESLPRLVEIYQAMRNNDFDETALDEALRDNGIKKYTMKLQDLIEDCFGLEEGFRPLTTKNSVEDFNYDY